MSMTNIAEALNNIPDAATRDAMFRAFFALKDAFDNHTHQQSATDDTFTSKPATDAPGKSGGTRATFPG